MNYWWMNTDPTWWDINKEMSPWDEADWDARTKKGRLKKYARQTAPADIGLCYQGYGTDVLAAELLAVKGLHTRNGQEFVRFRLIRLFKPPVPWRAIHDSNALGTKRVRQGTFFKLSEKQFGALLGLASMGEQKSHSEQIELERFESVRDLEQIRKELRRLTPKDPALITVSGKSYSRDDKTIADLKIVRGHKCQMCGKWVAKKDGSRYVEAAHITPKKQKGPEMPSNILILCPNHHKEFDLGEKEILERSGKLFRLLLNKREYSIDLGI